MVDYDTPIHAETMGQMHAKAGGPPVPCNYHIAYGMGYDKGLAQRRALSQPTPISPPLLPKPLEIPLERPPIIQPRGLDKF